MDPRNSSIVTRQCLRISVISNSTAVNNFAAFNTESVNTEKRLDTVLFHEGDQYD